MRSRSAAYSWLLTSKPPIDPGTNGLGWTAGEALLWWNVVRQALHDVLTARESDAYDAAEWINISGAYLIEELFGVPVSSTRAALAHAITQSKHLRRRARGHTL